MAKNDQGLKDLQSEIKKLNEEMKKIEDKAFTEFCKKLKIKNVSEFEISQGGNEFFDKKCDLEQSIAKLETELSVLVSNLNLNQIQTLKASLENEES